MTTPKTYGELQAYIKWFKQWNYTTMSHKEPKEVLQAEYNRIQGIRAEQWEDRRIRIENAQVG